MFFVLKSRYRREKIALLGKVEKLRKRLDELGHEKVKFNELEGKLEEENRILKQKLKERNLEIKELKEKLEDIDGRLKTKVEEKTEDYKEKLKRIQSGYDKLIFELDELRH
ncbi:MAG: hypothetical protein KAH04_07395 [Psychrilyobacter sp.]|nr:hypothetical protein [Psychrilyobacter sp.]